MREVIAGRLPRLIALFKLLEAAVLIAVGVGALKLLHKDLAAAVEHWVELLGLDPNNHSIDAVLQKASNVGLPSPAYQRNEEAQLTPIFGCLHSGQFL